MTVGNGPVAPAGTGSHARTGIPPYPAKLTSYESITASLLSIWVAVAARSKPRATSIVSRQKSSKSGGSYTSGRYSQSSPRLRSNIAMVGHSSRPASAQARALDEPPPLTDRASASIILGHGMMAAGRHPVSTWKGMIISDHRNQTQRQPSNRRRGFGPLPRLRADRGAAGPRLRAGGPQLRRPRQRHRPSEPAALAGRALG